MGFIYKITNIVSGKCYIGETAQDDPEKRWKHHLKKINKNQGCPAGGFIWKYADNKELKDLEQSIVVEK